MMLRVSTCLQSSHVFCSHRDRCHGAWGLQTPAGATEWRISGVSVVVVGGGDGGQCMMEEGASCHPFSMPLPQA